ncbi:MAG: HAD hydrolase family protein, partial [Erysipelotrichaceae bacterium]|nr:HAD hydrolase family protein [Erysipelotrichaceae bacterium]
GEHKRYINYVDDVVIQTQAATHGTIPDIGEYKGEKIYQCLAFVNSEVRKKLEDLLDQCSITSWNDTGIDIIAKTGGKAAGIMKFLEKEGLKRSQVMAFGDGENDIAMIKFAGVGVSMGNGKDALKAAAEYVTTSVDDDGIYNALKHFELI